MRLGWHWLDWRGCRRTPHDFRNRAQHRLAEAKFLGACRALDAFVRLDAVGNDELQIAMRTDGYRSHDAGNSVGGELTGPSLTRHICYVRTRPRVLEVYADRENAANGNPAKIASSAKRIDEMPEQAAQAARSTVLYARLSSLTRELACVSLERLTYAMP